MEIIIKQRYWLYGLVVAVLYLGYCVWDPALPFLYESGAGKKAIVIGATSGMGRETARLLVADGYTVGCVGRRSERLNELKKELGDHCVPRSIDVSKEQCMQQVRDLIEDMGGFDLMVISILSFPEHAPTRHHMSEQEKAYAKELYEFDVDLFGFWRCARTALQHFKQQGKGHLVGVSSMDELGGASVGNNIYCAVKAFIGHYLRAHDDKYYYAGTPIICANALPGYVELDRLNNKKQCYWQITAQQAGEAIFEGIKRERRVIYVGKRQRIVAWLYRLIPRWVYKVWREI